MIKAADNKDVELTAMNNSAGKDRLADLVDNLRPNSLNELWSLNIQKLEKNSTSLHHTLSLYLVHSKYETFLFAVFRNN